VTVATAERPAHRDLTLLLPRADRVIGVPPGGAEPTLKVAPIYVDRNYVDGRYQTSSGGLIAAPGAIDRDATSAPGQASPPTPERSGPTASTLALKPCWRRIEAESRQSFG